MALDSEEKNFKCASSSRCIKMASDDADQYVGPGMEQLDIEHEDEAVE